MPSPYFFSILASPLMPLMSCPPFLPDAPQPTRLASTTATA